MLTSLSFVFLLGLAMAALCQKFKIPRIIGMLVTGILLGPCVLNWLSELILGISSELRQMALIIILLKAGLSLNLADLKKVGRPALMMSCVPASFEILAFVIFAPAILHISRVEAAVMGAVLGAVSPAVVIPRMVQLMETKYGTDQRIPQMIMAGASCDDIFVIVLFSTFTNMAQGGSAHVADFINIPVSILLGIALGAVAGYGLSLFFETAYAKEYYVRNSMKVILILGMSFFLMSVETWLKGKVSVSGLLAVVSMAAVIRIKCIPKVSKRLSEKFGKHVDCSRGDPFCTGRCSCGYPLYHAGRDRSSADDLCGLNVPGCGSIPLYAGHEIKQKRAAVLCDRLSSKSNGTGSDRIRTSCNGIALWPDRSVSSGFSNPDHSAFRSSRNGSDL